MIYPDYLIEQCECNFQEIRKKYPNSIYMSGLSYHGETIWHNENNFKNDSGLYEHKMQVHSISKLYTMLCLIISVQEKKICLFDSISKFIKPLNLRYLDMDYSNEITLEHLLTHSSGLQHEAPIGNNFFPENSKAKHINSLQNTELLFRPGISYNYSNLGYDFIGYIISLVYHTDFETLMQNMVFQKLGLQDVTYRTNNECQNASIGMIASFKDLLKGLDFFTGNKSISISPELWKKIHSFFQIRDKQISGYGYANKVFKIGNTEVNVATGIYFDTSIVQMWSVKYGIGMLSVFQNANVSVIDEINGFYPSNIFYRIIHQKESQNRIAYYQINQTVTINLDCLISQFVSCSNMILFTCKMGNLFFYSWDCKEWNKTINVEENYYCSYEGEFQLDRKDNTIVGIYFNGFYNFEYFYLNEDNVTMNTETEGGIILAQYKIKPKDVLSREEKVRLAVWNRLNKISLIEKNERLYINGILKLTHIKDNYYLKANMEPVYINMDYIIIGNIRYDKI